MAGLNKVILIGNIGKDPEVRQFDNGGKKISFSLATNESYKDKDGNWQTQTEWHNIVVWRDLAERAENNLKKGATVYVEGKISYRKYTASDGTEKSATDITASVLRSLERKESTGTVDHTARNFPEAAKEGREINAKANESAVDDLPF